MIVDAVENALLYAGLGERMARGLALIEDTSLYAGDPGRYEIDGDNLFYMIQRYTTKDRAEAHFEAHREYADIQVVIEGAETIGWAPADRLDVVEAYKPDIYMCADPEYFTEIRLPRGRFAIFLPSDAHKPCYDYREKGAVAKLVVKVRIR